MKCRFVNGKHECSQIQSNLYFELFNICLNTSNVININIWCATVDPASGHFLRFNSAHVTGPQHDQCKVHTMQCMHVTHATNNRMLHMPFHIALQQLHCTLHWKYIAETNIKCNNVHRTHATWMFWKKRDKVRWKNLQEWGEIGRPTLVPSAKVWCWFELFFGNRQHVGKGLGVRRGRKCKKADKKQMKESLEKSIVWSNVLRWGQQQKRRWMEKDFVWDHVKERGEW